MPFVRCRVTIRIGLYRSQVLVSGSPYRDALDIHLFGNEIAERIKIPTSCRRREYGPL